MATTETRMKSPRRELSRLEKDAERLTRRVEMQLNELNDGYARLQELALTAPLGAAGAASKSRLDSSLHLGAWDAERHRDIIFESREVKRRIDLKTGTLFMDRNGSKSNATERRKQQHRQHKAQRADLNEGDLADYPVALRRYRGGFHGEGTLKGSTMTPSQKTNKPVATIKQSTKTTIKHTKKSLAAATNARRVIQPTIIVKDDATARAAVDYAKEALQEAAVAARRAALAANRAADRAANTPQSTALPQHTYDDDVPEYRVLIPSKYSDPFTTVMPSTQPPIEKVTTLKEDFFDDDKPQVERIDGRVLLARPTAMDDAIPSLPRQKKNVHPETLMGHTLEAERLRAVSEASPLYIAEGSARSKARPKRAPSFSSHPVFPPSLQSDDHEDCVNLVARLLLAKNSKTSTEEKIDDSQQDLSSPAPSRHSVDTPNQSDQ